MSWLKSSSLRLLINLRFACEILLVPGMYLNIILTSKGNAVLQCCFHKMKKTRFLKIDAKNNSNAVFISEIYVLFATAVYA